MGRAPEASLDIAGVRIVDQTTEDLKLGLKGFTMTGRPLRAALAVLAFAALAALAAVRRCQRQHQLDFRAYAHAQAQLRLSSANYVNVILSGFPPFTPFEGTLEFDGAGIGPIQLTTDENGNFDSSSVGFVGSFEPVTFTATIVWAGGTLRESLFVDCSKPASKEDCKNGGWRNYPQFNNQGLCLAFVSGGKSPAGA